MDQEQLARVASVIAWGLDGEYNDEDGEFYSASPDGNTVRLTVTDGETESASKFVLTVEAAK